ncbi:MAG: TIGR02117 family protein [Pseudomonadota bacterium]
MLVFLALALTAGTLVPRGPVPLAPEAIDAPEIVGESPVPIRVATGIIHTDIAVPLDRVPVDWLDRFAADGLPVNHPGAKWLVFGWGSRAIYPTSPTFSDMRPAALFRAFTYDQTAMRVAVVADFQISDGVRQYEITRSRFSALIKAIDAGFQQGVEITLAQPGYGPDDRFYNGTGWFNILVGCNTWAASALRQAGLTTGLWNPLPDTLLISLDLYN